MGVCSSVRDLQPGEVGFADEEVIESRRSKLVPYGLLSSSSFHILLSESAVMRGIKVVCSLCDL